MAALQKGAEAVYAKPLFFICGAIKSGTTWLQLMLDAHPDIACRGEGHLPNMLCRAWERRCKNTTTKSLSKITPSS
ncbi:MAG: sulfotransferase, partial [Alphaproteobacteria bacterium]